MKKLAILAVLACMVFGFAASASAVDLDAKGQFQFQMNLIDNADFLNDKDSTTGVRGDDDLNFWFRARTEFRFIANENLWAVLYTQYKTRIGSANNANEDGNSGATGSQLTVKRAYLQYRFPGTELLTTAGLAPVDLPGAAAGNMVLAGTERGLFMMETPITDQIAVAAAFIRNTDRLQDDGGVNNLKDELDIFYAALPITIDGLAATPYFAYAIVGNQAAAGGAAVAGLAAPATLAQTKNANAWWLGTSFSMDMFDPIVFNADIVYGSVDADVKQNDRSGLFFDASLAYTGLDFVQPKLVFAYGTGEDDKTENGSERLPVIANDWAFGTTYFGGSALTSADLDSNEQTGFWTIGLSLEKISFFEKLSHDVHFLYIQGTNDSDLIENGSAAITNTNIAADGKFLTTKDNAFEVDLNTNYQIYDELAAIVELGYVNMNLDKDVWDGSQVTGAAARAGKDADCFKFAVGLVYKF
ncbi:outer membrane homotrimeric porin [Desulfovibrio sp. JC022]|uniref:outer membrane homotrimeric porin n=1 Tax=Desulfovibrio sp. JC022 TaxID=2593642 RepID=UPI0013D70218|nr:outer membrane homotrimeric porin [Desulfovibrio sp. JC022]NDV24790.1 hypothetical protein [Desulfovibrio sp. JC022]